MLEKAKYLSEVFSKAKVHDIQFNVHSTISHIEATVYFSLDPDNTDTYGKLTIHALYAYQRVYDNEGFTIPNVYGNFSLNGDEIRIPDLDIKNENAELTKTILRNGYMDNFLKACKKYAKYLEKRVKEKLPKDVTDGGDCSYSSVMTMAQAKYVKAFVEDLEKAFANMLAYNE